MKGFVFTPGTKSLENEYFRRVVYTAKYSQLVLMCLKPEEDIGEEVHMLDQFISCEQGTGTAMMDGIAHHMTAGVSVLIPAGTKHNIINASADQPMRLYTVYAPPNHRDGVIHKTKADAETDTEHFSGDTTEWA